MMRAVDPGVILKIISEMNVVKDEDEVLGN